MYEGQSFLNSLNRIFNAIDIYVGDKLLDANGNILIVEDSKVEVLDEPVKVYNFQVEDFHTYHVGKNGVLVHNASCGLDGKATMTEKDWESYLDGDVPKPSGELKLLDGSTYDTARVDAKNTINPISMGR